MFPCCCVPVYTVKLILQDKNLGQNCHVTNFIGKTFKETHFALIFQTFNKDNNSST